METNADEKIPFDDLCKQLDGVEKQIAEIEVAIVRLKYDEEELSISIEKLKNESKERQKKKNLRKQKQEELQKEDPVVEYKKRLVERFSYKNTDLIKKIYAENRAKAKAAHDRLLRLNYNGQHATLPLYNQPSDLDSYKDNIESFKLFRPRLLKFLQMKKICENKIEHHIQVSGEEKRKQWLKQLEEKNENNPKRKVLHRQKMRQFYEKEFPEIKKHREQQERVERLGSRSVGARSEAELDEITNNLRELDSSEKQMHLLAVDTPSLISTYDRRSKFINNNGLIRNFEAFEQERKSVIIWTDKEKQLFREKYAQFSKDFERISSFIPSKDCSDCVLFYYQNKKKEGFRSSKSKNKKKGKLNRSGQISLRSQDHNRQKQTRSNKEVNPQEEEIEEEETLDESNASEEEGNPTNLASAAAVAENNDAQSTDILMQEKSTEVPLEKEQPVVNKPKGLIATTLSITEKCSTEADICIKTPVTNVIVTTSAPVSKPKQTQVKVFNTRSGKYNQKANVIDQQKTEKVVEEMKTTAEVSHPPLKMTIMVTSPSHIKDSTSMASVASIISETITSASMTSHEQTVADINKSNEEEVKAKDIKDINSPSVILKVDELIRQHLSKMPEHSDPSRWSEQEMTKAVEGLKKHGRSWSHISKLVETKSEAQCKNFYFNYKKKFNLESILGIAKCEDTSESAVTEQQHEELMQYLQELDREEEEEERQKEKEREQEEVRIEETLSEKEKVNDEADVTEGKAVTLQETSVINEEEKNLGAIEVNADEFNNKVTQDQFETDVKNKSEIIKTEEADGSYNKAQATSCASQEKFKQTAGISKSTVLRPPPPLVADSQYENKSIVQEFAMLNDRNFLKKKFKLSLDQGHNSPHKEAPPLISTNLAKDEHFNQRQKTIVSPNRPHALSSLPQNEVCILQQEHLFSNLNQSEQSAAIQAFNTRRPGFMSSLQTKGIVTGEQQSPRFRLPVSPSFVNSNNIPFEQQSIPQNSPFVLNNQNIQQVARPQIPSPMSQPLRPCVASPNSSKHLLGTQPLYNNMKRLHSPGLQKQYPPNYPNPKFPILDELQALREIEYFQRQNEIEHNSRVYATRSEHQPTGLLRQCDVEPEKDPKFLQIQKELEMRRFHEMQRQKKELRLLNFEKQKDPEMFRKSRTQNESTMSQDMIISLEKHFSPFENLTTIDKRDVNKDLASPRDLLSAARDLPREMPHNISPHREDFLITLPPKPKNIKEYQKRAASIPDLRKDISSSMRENPYEFHLRHERQRTQPGNEMMQRSRDTSQNQLQMQLKSLSQQNLFEKFPLEQPNIQEVPLEPLSRPSSAELEGKFIENKVYGITTGLARKATPLTSITGVPLHERSERQESFTLSKPVNIRQKYSTSVVNRAPIKEIEAPTKRKAAIVRPWEITGEGIKSNEPSRTGTPQPVIHLAATSNKYKKEIINIAQMNSPAPESFPKFNFDTEAINETFKKADKSPLLEVPFRNTLQAPLRMDLSSVNRKKSQSFSDQSLSPTFPLPLRKEDNFEQSTEAPARLRSDSEETVSADEVEQKEADLLSKQPSVGKSSLSNLPPPAKISQVTPLSSNAQVSQLTESGTHLTQLQLLNTSQITQVLPSDKCASYSQGIAQSIGSDTELKRCNLDQPIERISPIVFNQASKVFSSQAYIENIEEKNGESSDVRIREEEKHFIRTLQTQENLQERLGAIRTPEPKNETFVYSSSSSIHLAVLKPSTQVVTANTTSKIKTVNTIFPEKVELPVVQISQLGGQSCQERPESPDIYDDFKKVNNYKDLTVQDYKEQQPTDINFDLFKRDSGKTNDCLSELTSASACLIKEESFLFSDTEKGDDNVDSSSVHGEKAEVTSAKEKVKPPHSETQQVTSKTEQEESNDVKADVNRRDAGTPVMDEPFSGDKNIERNVNTSSPLKGSSKSPLPEVKTPLLDEPSYDFDLVTQSSQESGKERKGKSKKSKRSHSRKSQDQFESITPPSSPERRNSQDDRGSQGQNVNQAATSVAFPYSALAFNVNSRPGSRGSSCHSGERSPGIEDEISILRKHKKYREPEIDLKNMDYLSAQIQSNDQRRAQKRRYHQSGSHGTSTNFIRSPEFEYHDKISRQSPRIAAEDRSFQRHSKHYDNAAKRKRSSSPDSVGSKHTR